MKYIEIMVTLLSLTIAFIIWLLPSSIRWG